MSAIYSFESTNIRVLGTPQSPLFVAVDICAALGFLNPSKALGDHVDPEDLTKITIDTAGGKQTVNAVNESGMYALIFGSKLPAAKRFKKWVTSEVLPQIRKTGQYQADSTLNTEQQYTLRKAVKAKAKDSSLAYQTIYNALYDYFKVSSYKDLKPSQLQAAITFVDTFSIPALEDKRKAELPDGALVLTGEEALRVRNFVYSWRYLFSDELCIILRLLHTLKSPFEARFYEAVTSLNLALLEKTLERHGYPIKGCLTR